MKNLPKGMIPDRDNQVFYDTEKEQFYIIQWIEGGNSDYPIRHYIQQVYVQGKIQNKMTHGR